MGCLVLIVGLIFGYRAVASAIDGDSHGTLVNLGIVAACGIVLWIVAPAARRTK